MGKEDLKLDWASYKSAKYACENWHYSKTISSAQSTKIGVWESGMFKGAIVFAMGSNKNIGKPYGLKNVQTCELTRIALRKHDAPVSRMISIAIRMLKRKYPDLRLIVSYADSNQGHFGGIYKATNWIYEGEFASERGIMLNGTMVHRRTVNSKYGTSGMQWLKDNIDPDAHVIMGTPKYKYLMPLDADIMKTVLELSKPYPKAQANLM